MAEWALTALLLPLFTKNSAKAAQALLLLSLQILLRPIRFCLQAPKNRKNAHCDLLNEGKLAAFALTEPGAGSDAGAVSTSAVKDKEAGTYTLNGAKAFITNGGIADTYLVFANTRKPAASAA